MDKYVMTVRIEIGTNETKKNAVRDNITGQLQTAKDNGNIESASWHIEEIPVVEGGII